MSTDVLSAFSHTILVLVGRDGAGPHDLVRMARTGRIYWAAAESQFYSEPKRLERLGYLTARKEPGRTRERTHYTLTEHGLAAIRDWAARPTAFPRMQQEGPVRVMAASLVGDAPVLESLAALRDDIHDLRERVEQGERIAEAMPPERSTYLLLNHRLQHRLLQAHLDWIDEVEQELGAS